MKKLYTFFKNTNNRFGLVLLTCLLFAGFSSKALVSTYYSFSSSVGTYNEITGGTVLGDDFTDDQRFVDPAAPLGSTGVFTGPGFPIGFNFTFDGTVYDNFGVNANGWIVLGNSGTVDVSAANYGPISSTGGNNIIAVFARDIQSQTGGNIQFLTTGTAPNQTLVVQWKNYKKYGTNGTGDTLNFQIRLNESNGSVEFSYGTFVLNTNTGNTLQLGLRGSSTTDFNNREITTNWATSLAGTSNAATCVIDNLVYPAFGTSFLWSIPLPCVAPPTAGTAISSLSASCPNIPFSLSLSGSTIASALSYQWQSSPNNIAWTNISAGVSLTYATAQSNSTYYRCIVTCSGVDDTSTVVFVTTNSFFSCYCTSGATSTFDDDIGNFTFGSINNGVGTPATQNPTAVNTFSDFTNLPVQTFMQGINYPISITQINSAGFYQCQAFVYIDYNQDGVYDTATEKAYSGVTTAAVGGNTINGTVTIPLSSLAGNTGLRVVLVEGTFNTVLPCGTYTWGETEDYVVNIQLATPCTAPPSAGLAYANDSTVCPSVNYQLNLSGSSIASGLSYQWQSSSNGIVWANVAGAITINYLTSQTTDNYYRCLVTCAGVNDTSSVVFISTNSFTSCYCNSSSTSTFGSDIGNVTFGSLNNGSATPATSNPASVNTYTDYTSLTPPTLLQGINYPISVSQIDDGLFSQSLIRVYVDFDQNGIYDPNNEVALDGQTIAGTGGNVLSSNFTIPITALTGTTGMRVVLMNGIFSTMTPCGTYFNGETEDYVVNIQTPLPCTTPPAAGTTVANVTSICPNVPFDLNLIGNANASGLTYQWQSSSNGLSWSNIIGANSINYQASQTASTYYQCIVTCSGVSSNSVPLLVTIGNFYNCYCSSGATSTNDDDIGNVTFGFLNNGVATPATQNPTSVNTYSDFTTLPPFSYIQTLTYPISMTQINLFGFYQCSGEVFIDFDHDGIFDPSTETVLSGTTASGQNTISGTFTIPPTSLPGITRMRYVLKEGTSPVAQPCGTYTWGETEDYLVNILLPNSCSIPFIAGIAKSSSALVCASDVFTLSIDSLPPDTGFTFQWQQSFDNLSWNNIPGAIIQIYSGSQNFDSWYRCNVTCNGGTMVSSTPIQILNKSVTQCDYCNTSISGNCSTDYYLDSVVIGGTTFNNAHTGCAANAGFAYSKYPISGNTTADIARGNYYDLFVKTAGSCNLSVWIDYDQSGTFDPSEWIQVSQATDSGQTATVPLVLPLTAKLGATGMRVRSRKAGNANFSADACNPYGSGETEDYYVTIVDAISTGKELANDKNVRIYPNPSSGVVSIEYHSDEAKSLQVKLMNTEGQEIYSETIDKFKGVYTHKMDLSSYSKGIYFVQFVTDKSVSNKKIVLN